MAGQNSDVSIAIGASMQGLVDGLNQATGAVRASTDQMAGMFGGLGRAVDSLKAPFAALAGVLAGGKMFHDAIHGATDWAASVGLLARTLGTSTESASGLAVALHGIGVESETYVSAVYKLQRSLKENEDQINANKVATRDSKGGHLEIQEVMQNGIRRLAELSEGYERNALSMLLFGRGAQEMEPLQRLTNARLAEAAEEARKLGLVMTSEGVSAARTYKDAMREVGLVAESVQVQVGAQLLPRLTELGRWFAHEGPALIQPVVSAMTALADIMSSTGFKVAAALLVLRSGVVPAFSAAAGAITSIGAQYTQGLAQLVQGCDNTLVTARDKAQVLSGVIGGMVNPWVLAALAIGGAVYALERWNSRAERAADEAHKAALATKGNVAEYDELAAKLKQIDDVMRDGTSSAEKKKQAEAQSLAVIEQLKAISPEFKQILENEGNAHLSLAEKIAKANAQRREALTLQAGDLKRQKEELERQRKELLDASAAGRNANAREQDPTLGETDLGPSPAALARAAKMGEQIKRLAKDAGELDELAAGPTVTKKPKGRFVGPTDEDAEKATSRHAIFMAKMRAEMLEGEEKLQAEWQEKYTEVWERSDTLTQKQYDDEIDAVDAFMRRKRDVYRTDRTVDDLREQIAEVRNNGELRLAIQREIIAKEVKIHGEGSEKVLAERRRLAQMTVQVDEENARLRLAAGNAERSRELALLDVDAQGIAHKQQMGQITAQQEIAQLRVLEDQKFALKLASVQAEQQIADLTLEQKQALAEREQTLYVEHYAAVVGLAERAQREMYETAKGYIGPTVQAMTSATAGMLQGTQSLADGIKSIWQSILNTVLGVINKMVTEWLAAKAIMSAGSLFGGGGGGGPIDEFSTVAPTLIEGALASGGPVVGGKTYLVGENGPELFRAGLSGYIVPNAARPSALSEPGAALPSPGEGGGLTVNATFQVSALDAQSTARHLDANAQTYAQKIGRMIYKGMIPAGG